MIVKDTRVAQSPAFLYDPNEHDENNRRNVFYWDTYIEELLDQLGLCGHRVMPEHLEESLESCSALILGARNCATLKNPLKRFI